MAKIRGKYIISFLALYIIQFLHIQYMYYRNTVENVSEMHGILYFKLLLKKLLRNFSLSTFINSTTSNEGPVRIQYKCLIWNLIHSQPK